MKDSILKFTEQFQFQPEIQNADKLTGDYQNFILGGMGGSHLAAGLLHIFRPGINLYIQRDYGLPPYEDQFMSKSLFIASSYSGNTEETLDFAEAAYLKGYSVAVITTGGKLLDYAKEHDLPYILIPDIGLQPRLATGFFTIALSTFVEPTVIPEVQNLSENLDIESIRAQGEEIAKQMNGKIPVIYSSGLNRSLSYFWKITLNETGKIPAFQNLFPELNHNEMQSFDYSDATKSLTEKFAFIILHDSEDHPRNELRMRTTEDLYQEKGYDVISIYLEGENAVEKVFKSVILANWAAITIAEQNGVDPEPVHLIEEFKKRIKDQSQK